jgi:hypothetical protein
MTVAMSQKGLSANFGGKHGPNEEKLYIFTKLRLHSHEKGDNITPFDGMLHKLFTCCVNSNPCYI